MNEEKNESDGKRLSFWETENSTKRKGAKERKHNVYTTYSWCVYRNEGTCSFDADKYCLRLSFQKCAFVVYKHRAINFCNKKSIKSFIPVMTERQRHILFLFIDENSISPKTQPGIVKSLLIYFNFWNSPIFSHAFSMVLHSS